MGKKITKIILFTCALLVVGLMVHPQSINEQRQTTLNLENLQFNVMLVKMKNSRAEVIISRDRRFVGPRFWGGIVSNIDSTLARRRYSFTTLSDRRAVIKSDTTGDNSTLFVITISIPDSVNSLGRAIK